MKKIGLFTVALLISGVAGAQTSELKNEHGVKVRSEAKSDTRVSANKGENVSTVASSKSHSSISAANTRTSDKAARKGKRKTVKEKTREAKSAKSEIVFGKEAANTHTYSIKNEAKVEGVETKAELNPRMKVKTELAARRKEQAEMTKEEMKSQARELKSQAKSEANATSNTGFAAGSAVRSEVATSRSAVNGAAKAATRAQIRRAGVTGRVGAAVGLHL